MARTVKVDMTDVETYSKASEGIHTAKVVEIQEKESQAGDPMLQFKFEVTKGVDKGCAVFENFALTDKALWKFKAFLLAIGMKAEGKLKLDLDKLIGKTCDIEVFWDEYNGQTRAKISDYYKAGKGMPEPDEDEDDDDEDEAPKKAKKSKAAPKKKPASVEDDDDEDDDENPWDDDDDDDDEDEKPKKKSAKKPAKKSKAAAAPAKKGKKKPEPEPDEDEDDDDDDDWEEDD